MVGWLHSELEHEDLLHTDRGYAHDVAKLFFGAKLVEKLLFKKIIQQSDFAGFKLVMAWSVSENTSTAIIDVLVDIHTLVLVNSLVVKFDASLAVQHVFIHAVEIQTRLSFVDDFQSLAFGQVALDQPL